MQENRELSLNTRPQAPSLPLGGSAVLNDTPVACQTRGPTDPQGDRFPHIPAASAATYPLRCFAPQWARFDNRQKRPAHQPLPSLLSAAAAQRAISRPGASVSFVSDGPISSNSGRNGEKNAGRNCVSALPQRAIPGSDLLRILADIAFHHRCRSKGLRVRSPARRLPRPLAPATVGVFRSYRHPPKPSPRVAHPLKPSP